MEKSLLKLQASVSIATSGVLENFEVQEGDKVDEGQVLGNVYNISTSQTVQSRRDLRDIALRDRDLYVENYESNLSGIGGEDEYNIGLRRQNELVSKAEADYQSALGTLSTTYVKSPIEGTVVDISIDQGEVVIAGSQIVEVANLDALTFEVQVDQEDFGEIQLGHTAEVVLDAYPTQIFPGKVAELPLTVDSETGDFIVKVEVGKSEEYPILVGMEGDVDIIIEKDDTGQTALTFDAVFDDNDGKYVWMMKEGRLVKQYVEVGLEGNLYTVITSQIDFDNVVIPQDSEFEEGYKVTLNE